METFINGFPRSLMLGSLFLVIYINDVHKITDNDATVVLFADDTSILVTGCNVEGGTDGRIKLNGSARNGSKLKTVQYVDIRTCENFTLSNLLPITSQPILTQTPTQRYLPQNAVTLYYTSIMLHKKKHNGIYHKMPLPCTTPVYCYTKTNTAVSTTKCRYLALHQYIVNFHNIFLTSYTVEFRHTYFYILKFLSFLNNHF